MVVPTQQTLRVERGVFHAYFLYDVANTINLKVLQKISGEGFQKAQLELHAVTTPNYIQFIVPPLTANLPDKIIAGLTAKCRVKLYDYGIVSIKLSFNYSGNLSDFSNFALKLRQSEALVSAANESLNSILSEITPALNKPQKPLVEDYFVIEVSSLEPKLTASDLLKDHRNQLTSLLLGEPGTLTTLEEQDALKVVFSYFETDLVIVHWDVALVLDTHESASAVEDILEFANTQLVELRTYDKRLDAELDEIYKWDVVRSGAQWYTNRSKIKESTDQLRGLLIDIRELNDRANNALKIIGDAYYARLYRGISSRLGLVDWQQQIESKLASIGEIYRFATDQIQYSRSEFLEIIIIILIVVEIILGLLRIGH